jgi:hypothetical protein
MNPDDRAALRQLAWDYASCVDRRDADGLLELFTADGLVGSADRSVPPFAGEAGLRRMVDQVGRAFVKTMHNVFNHTFASGGEGEASGETTCIASHIIEDEAGAWKTFDMALRYANRYAKVDDAWRFAERRLTVEWVETRPVERFDPAGLAMRADGTPASQAG